jgi:hypothetical protein
MPCQYMLPVITPKRLKYFSTLSCLSPLSSCTRSPPCARQASRAVPKKAGWAV